MPDLDGKIAWVTGAGSGIGQAAARALAGAGASLVLSGRRAEALEETAASLGDAEVMLAPLDVTDLAGARAVAEQIDQRFGRLDVQLNNAGINIVKRAWEAFEPDDWDAVIRTNVNGLY